MEISFGETLSDEMRLEIDVFNFVMGRNVERVRLMKPKEIQFLAKKYGFKITYNQIIQKRRKFKMKDFYKRYYQKNKKSINNRARERRKSDPEFNKKRLAHVIKYRNSLKTICMNRYLFKIKYDRIKKLTPYNQKRYYELKKNKDTLELAKKHYATCSLMLKATDCGFKIYMM